MRGRILLLLSPAPSHSLLSAKAQHLQLPVLHRPLEVLPVWQSYLNTS